MVVSVQVLPPSIKKNPTQKGCACENLIFSWHQSFLRSKVFPFFFPAEVEEFVCTLYHLFFFSIFSYFLCGQYSWVLRVAVSKWRWVLFPEVLAISWPAILAQSPPRSINVSSTTSDLWLNHLEFYWVNCFVIIFIRCHVMRLHLIPVAN